MNRTKNQRLIVVGAFGVALVLGLARCTPLNPSMAKSLLKPGAESGALSGIKPGSKYPPDAASTPMREQILSFQTQVMDVALFADLRDRLTVSNDIETDSIQMIELTKAQINDLRELRRTPVWIGEDVPAEAAVYVGVEQSRPKLLRSELAAFATELKHRDDGTWELCVPRSLDSDKERTADAVLKNLDSVMIRFRLSSETSTESVNENGSPENSENARPKKPVHRPLGLEPRIHSVNEIRSLETSRRLLSLISSSQAL